ncbi:MAG: hypothetical protein HAW67_05095 [Endozoicomonadaceae bacterium]|nr:hypothetical protein [Endozoicomonadaceae bacterium]
MKVVITAGFDKALHAIALVELLRRNGHEVQKIIVVTPFNIKRLQALIKQRGVSGVQNALKRLLNKTGPGLTKDPLSDFLAKHAIEERSLKVWAAKNNSDYQTVKSLNDEAVCTDLSMIKPDYVLYAGGGILKSLFIDAVQGTIINAHSGPLPQIRGMNACEWSLLLKLTPTVTIHFIDKGIDTGRIITSVTVDRDQDDGIDTLRARCVVIGIEQMINIMNKKIGLNTDSSSDEGNDDRGNVELTHRSAMSRQCFVLAPVLKDLLNNQLNSDNEK